MDLHQQQQQQLVDGAAPPQKKDEAPLSQTISLSKENKILIAIIMVALIVFLLMSPKSNQKSTVLNTIKGLKDQTGKTSSINVQKQKVNNQLSHKLEQSQSSYKLSEEQKSNKIVDKPYEARYFLANSKQKKVKQDILVYDKIAKLKKLIDPDAYNQGNYHPQVSVEKESKAKKQPQQIDLAERIKEKQEQQKKRHDELKKYQQQKKKEDQLKKKQEQEKKQMQEKKEQQQKESQKKQQEQKRKLEQQKKRQQEQRKKRQQEQKKIQEQRKRQEQQKRKQLQMKRQQQQKRIEQQNKKKQQQQDKKRQQQAKKKLQQQQQNRRRIQQYKKKEEQIKRQQQLKQTEPPKKPLIEDLQSQNKKRRTSHHQDKVEEQNKRQQIEKVKKKVQDIEKNNQQISKNNNDAMTLTRPPSKNPFPIDMLELFKIPDYLIPQFLWTYVDGIEQQTLFVRRCLQNMKYYSGQSQFQFIIINSRNYKVYLSHSINLVIDKTLDILQQRMKKQPSSNLKDHYPTIKRRLIMFHILNEKGGLFVESNVLFTQNLDWLKGINLNKYVNKGSIYTRAKYVGFFDIDHGTELKIYNKIGFIYETEKYMIQFPCFQPYFFTAINNEEYLTAVLNEYMDLLTHPQSLQQKISKYSLVMGAIYGRDLYYQVFYISQHVALRKKQMQIDAAGNHYGSDFAIDFFGLFTINQRYFPKKLQFTFENNHEQKMYWNLAKYTLEELEQTTGPLSYIVCMMFENNINNKLQFAYNNHARQEIHPQSFIGKFIIMNKTQPFIHKQIQINKINPQGKQWSNLPKIIWMFWDTGIKNSTLGNKLCTDNIKRYGQLSKFEIKQLNNSNIQQYIGKQINNKIDKFIENKKITTHTQTKSDFVRIAIIAKYGGIYMDASYFALENLDWIINISRYPSQFIFNRYGQLPAALMLFHPHFGQPFTWKFDKQANTKNMWLSAYQDSLLIAQPNQQIFWDWFDQFGRFITSSYEQSQRLMVQYGVYEDRWTQKDNVQLAAMDSIKNVIGKKEKQIRQKMMDKDYKGPKSAAQYYRIWSISGYRGQQKFRAHTNFDNTYDSRPFNSDNLFLWRYSQEYASGIIGKVNNIAKLYGNNIKYLNSALLKSYDSKFSSEIHQYSFFMKYLYNTTVQKINKVNDDLQLQYIKK